MIKQNVAREAVMDRQSHAFDLAARNGGGLESDMSTNHNGFRRIEGGAA